MNHPEFEFQIQDFLIDLFHSIVKHTHTHTHFGGPDTVRYKIILQTTENKNVQE